MKSPRHSATTLLAFALLFAAAAHHSAATRADDAATPSEADLLAILQSDAPSADKAIACKQLAIHGSADSVSELAKLLPDPQLSSWARIALEAIPGSAADDALRSAAEKLEGRLLVGMINSLGVRRDAGAVAGLTDRLTDSDVEVASAAAVALGRIGDSAATKALRAALASSSDDVRSAIAEGCVLCAERQLSEGNAVAAAELYDEIRSADVPLQRVIEGTRGAIIARGQDGIPLLVEQFRSPQKEMFQLALGTAREFPGDKVDQVLVAELKHADAARAALIVQAMADRPDTVDRAAVLQAATDGPKPVRLSAIDALARVGNADCLPALLNVALDTDTDLSQYARLTLAEMPGDDINAQVVQRLPQAAGKMYPLLLQLVGQRRIDAVPELLKAVDHADRDVRRAALTSLGETISLKRLSVLISQVVSPRHSDDAPVAQQALKAAGVRMADREACAAEISAAVDAASAVPTKIALLEVLGAVGGTNALAAMESAGKSREPQLQDISTRLLGEWMTEDAADVLLGLAREPANQFQVRALRGYIRIARQFVLPADRRADMCRKAIEAATRPDEQKLVLDVLKRYPTTESLDVAVAAMKTPALKDQATDVTLLIAHKLAAGGAAVGELLAKAGLDKVKLEIVKAEYGAGDTVRDVTEVLQKQVGDLPVITLASSSYNASFGGDPVPGTAKRLKIQYRINGRQGETSFAENSPIILPMPQ